MKYFAVLAVCLLGISSAYASYTVKWRHNLDAPPSSPTLYPNAAHPTGVVVTAGKQVICFNGDGSTLWTATLDSNAATPATVADLDGDGTPETIIELDSGAVVCLDASGKTRWRYEAGVPAGGFKFVTAADVYPTKGLELLVGHDNGWLTCLSAEGKRLWKFHGAKFRVGPVAVGDVDGDGAPEIVYGTDNGDVYCLSGDGRIKWRYNEMAPYGRSGPVLADLNGDGKCEVLITRSNVGNATCLMALDGKTGAYLWRTHDVMQGYVSNALGDFAGNGTLSVVHCDKGNWIYRVDGNGKEAWRTELGGKGIFFAPAIADINGDGRLEIIAGERGVDPATKACAYVVGPDGAIEDRLALGGGANAGPAVGDIDGDGKLEVIFALQDPNQIQAISWGASGRVAWPSVRGDSAMTGSRNVPMGKPVAPAPEIAVGHADVQTGDVVWGKNVWKVNWANPAPAKACLELSAALSDGTRETRAMEIKPGATHADVTWDLASGNPVRVSLRLLALGQSTPIMAITREVQAEPPDSCDIEGLRAACQRAVAAGRKAQADTVGLTARLLGIEARSQELDSLVKTAPPAQVAAKATSLRARAAALRGLAQSLETFWQSGQSGSFVWWHVENPWIRFDPLAVPATLDPNEPIRVRAYGNEFEDVVVSLLNISSDPIEVRCTFAPPELTGKAPNKEPDLAKHITLRRGVRVPTHFKGMTLDALPALDESRTVTLSPGVVSELWLVVDTHGLEPGIHALTLYVGSLSQTPTFRQIPIQIEVWPVALPDNVYAQINWNRVDKATTSDQALKDMLDHGENVAYSAPLATIPVDAKGNQAGPVDWSALDSELARVPPYFKFLFTGPPPQKFPDGMKPPPEGSDEQKAAFKTSVRVFAAHLLKKGFGYKRWAFYPIDEPWNTGFTEIPRLRRFCTLVKEADPKARNYADTPGLVRVKYLEPFKHLIDVWQPEMNVLKRDPKLSAWFRKNAGEFWAYEAAGPAKDLKPLGHYRAFAWLAWKFGCSGAGYWVYRDADQWWPLTQTDYGVVYQNGDQVIPSRRWEASRDGVEDYRAFYLLEKEIERARAAGKTAEADQAQALIDEAIEKVVGWQSRNIDEITRWTKNYSMDFNLVMDYRARIEHEIVTLRALLGAHS